MDLNHWKQRKKELNLTIDEIAKLANLPKGSVQNIFAGYVPNPRIDTVEAIEKALGINQAPIEWTDEERALGIGNYSTKLSPSEWEWLKLRGEVLRIKGEIYLNTLIEMIKGALK